jgi:predicted DNA-binding transcriptional regulator AlpA
MAKRRGALLTELPQTIHPEQRLTAEQAMQLTGRGRSLFYKHVKNGTLPQPCERDGRFVRWRAGTLIDALAGSAA